MKNIFKYLGIISIMIFSFYYTERIALYARNKNPIMQKIQESKNNLAVSSIDATVINEYIIPGINGLVVNVDESFNNMKAFSEFNSYYLVFDQVKPDITLENNKDKIINKGNSLKKSITLILENNEQIKKYLRINKIPASILITNEEYEKEDFFEQINNDDVNFDKLEEKLNKDNKNYNICLINKDNRSLCLKNEKYLVEPTKELNGSNLITIKKNIESGDIILIKKSANVVDFDLLIKQIKYQDLKIMYLSKFISEENN